MFPSRLVSVLGKGAALENNYSLDFDGSNDYVDCGDVCDLGSTTDFTITLWVKAVEMDNDFWISKYQDNDNRWYFESDDTETLFFYSVGGGSAGIQYYGASGGMTAHQGKWVHIAIVGDRSINTKGYINGVLEDTDTESGNNFDLDLDNSGSLYIGRYSSTYSESNIDEVAIWNTALSAGDISALYQAKGTADLNDDGNSANLKGWWRMGDGALDARTVNGLVSDQVGTSFGTELITAEDDRTFTSDTGFWSRESGVTFSSGTMLFTNVNGNAGFARSSFLTVGTTYKVTVECTSYTDGSLHVHNGSVFNFPDNTSTGTKTLYFTASGVLFQFRTGVAGADFAIDNLSIKPVVGNSGVLVNFDGTDFKTDTP